MKKEKKYYNKEKRKEYILNKRIKDVLKAGKKAGFSEEFIIKLVKGEDVNAENNY